MQIRRRKAEPKKHPLKVQCIRSVPKLFTQRKFRNDLTSGSRGVTFFLLLNVLGLQKQASTIVRSVQGVLLEGIVDSLFGAFRHPRRKGLANRLVKKMTIERLPVPRINIEELRKALLELAKTTLFVRGEGKMVVTNTNAFFLRNRVGKPVRAMMAELCQGSIDYHLPRGVIIGGGDLTIFLS
jgi:hypothetical protein